MKSKQLLIILLGLSLLGLSLLLLCNIELGIVVTNVADEGIKTIDVMNTADKGISNAEISNMKIVELKHESVVKTEKEVENRISWENNVDEHLYIAEVEPERLKQLIKGIAEHPELSAAEKEFTISTIRYSEKCPLECLDGYSKYKKEFEDKNPLGIDENTGYTFEELVNYHASFAERVREELKKDKIEEFFDNC